MTFSQYLHKVSLGGLLALLVIIPLMPKLMKYIWRVQRTLPENIRAKPLERPWFAAFSLLVLVVMVLLFIFGDRIPTHIIPPAVAILAATLGLLVIYAAKVEPITNVLKDIDWRTLIFLICLFCLVQAFNKTGILQSCSQNLYTCFGASANVVSTGICASHGKPVSFVTFMRYGVPFTLCQLIAAALYVLGMFYFVDR